MPLIVVVFAGILLQEHVLHNRTFSFRFGGQQDFNVLRLGMLDGIGNGALGDPIKIQDHG